MREKIIARLVKQLEVLSADAKTQVEHLRTAGGKNHLYVSVDDLLQEYDDVMRLLPNPDFHINLPEQVMICLIDLKKFAEGIDGHAELGTYDSLISEPFWCEIRLKAKLCLSVLIENL